MMEMNVSLSTDADGFLSQQCPSCNQRFKVVYGEGSDQPIGHCPYCDHVGEGCWWTEEQAAYLGDVVCKKVAGPALDDFARSMNRLNSSGLGIKVKTTVRHDPAKTPPLEPDDDMVEMMFDCCGERIKHDRGESRLNCVICGRRYASSQE